MHDGVALDDENAVAEIADRADLDIGPGHVVIDGYDVTSTIRTPEIDRAAAAAARLPGVRRALVARQRREGEAGGIVMEGRDIGSVVFPGADVKIYLDAAPEERARRRAADPAHGISRPGAVLDIGSEMAERDRSDRTRKTSPLTKASDAVAIDTTAMSIEETVNRVLEVIDEAFAKTG